MSSLDKAFIQSQIQAVSQIRSDYDWMPEHGLRVEKAINFGCEMPGQTLALMWAVGAREVAGVDPVDDHVVREETNLLRLQAGLQATWKAMVGGDEDVPRQDRILWNEGVPEFFKSEVTRVDHSIDFAIADYTKYVNLPESYYDLAFCDFVLHKFMWDKNLPDPEMTTRYVVGQMARTVRPGGFVAAYELARSQLNRPVDFRGLFEQTGLSVTYLGTDRINNWRGRGQTVSVIAQKAY